MATTKIFNNPTMVVNGQTVPVTLLDWAERTLSTADYALFVAASARQRTVESANTTLASTDSGQSVTINEDHENDAEWNEFWSQFTADPAVTFPTDWGHAS